MPHTKESLRTFKAVQGRRKQFYICQANSGQFLSKRKKAAMKKAAQLVCPIYGSWGTQATLYKAQ